MLNKQFGRMFKYQLSVLALYCSLSDPSVAQYQDSKPPVAPGWFGCALNEAPSGQAACDTLSAFYGYPPGWVPYVETSFWGGVCRKEDNGYGYPVFTGSVAKSTYCSPGYYASSTDPDARVIACPPGSPASLITNGYIHPPCVASVVEIDNVSKRTNGNCEKGVGNPIYPLRGTKREAVRFGYKFGGHDIQLLYDSLDLQRIWNVSANEIGAPRLNGLAGIGSKFWFFGFHRKLYLGAYVGGNFSLAKFVFEDGRSSRFWSNNGGPFQKDADNNDQLVWTGTQLLFFDRSRNSIEAYDSAGLLLSMSFIDGRKIDFFYSDASTPPAIAPTANMMLSAVESVGQRTIQLEYAQDQTLKAVTGPDELPVRLVFDGNRLMSIQWQDDSVRQFVYESMASSALTGIVDEKGIAYASWGYDANGLVVSAEYSGGVNNFSIAYSTPPSVQLIESSGAPITRTYNWTNPVGVSVQGPVGLPTVYSTLTINGLIYEGAASQPAGSGCAASTSSMSYDANGNVVQRDDFNGSRVCSSYDLSRNLEGVRVEGLANTQACASVTGAGASLPAGSRKVSSQWHPDWRLETKVAEPGRITTNVYSGQPDPFNGNAVASCAPGSALLPDGKPIVVLCKKVEQATTDANGSQGFAASLDAAVANRTWQWTYNQYGQVLTERDPVNNLTTTEYYADTTADHTMGDRQRVTNAKGHVTNYGKYNKHGQLLESTDPNGVLTVNTYDLRQRLTSTSVGGQTTVYTYDPVGQLTRVTLPDASWVGYEYDDAHRQVAVKDNLGNRIEYTLDNAGNRTAEAVKDPGGVLARQLTRSIDALGRVQQTTGRN